MDDPALRRFEALFGPEFGHGKPFDLAPLRRVLSALGEPHTKLPPVFHVTGTNGKGSTIAFLRAIAEAAGLRVHGFTKPHLFALRERFVIASEPARDDALIAAAERIAAIDPMLSQFDAQVAAAFSLFDDTPADLVLLETGMGGRDDSTNVLVDSALSIITPVALDHQDVLGATLSEIAAHKAGILKRGSPAISARHTPEAMAVIEAEAARIGAPLWRQGVEWDAYAGAGRLVVQSENRALDLPLPALAGAHQIDNAGLAVAAFLATPRFAITDDAFARGTLNARWPARLQRVTHGALAAPILAAGGDVWVDGGHNAHAGAALAHWASAMQRTRQAPLVVIFGARTRKDWAAALKPLANVATRVIAVPLSDGGVATDDIANYARGEAATSLAALSLADAMKNAAQLPAPRVLIFGSLLLAAQALAET